MPSLSVVIPAYNEENRLPGTLAKVADYLAASNWETAEVLVVNDGSRDRTSEVVSAFRANHQNVRLLDNPGNRGKGYSVRHGMLEASGDWVLFTDADLSAPIEELDKLVGAAQKRNADVAIGSRALDRSLIGTHQSAFREWAGRIFNLMMRIFTGLPFWDTQCGFKLFRHSAAQEVFRRQQLEGFGFDAEVLFLAQRLGFSSIEVAVRWNHVEGTKVSMFRDSIGMFSDLARVRWFQLRGLYR